MESIGHVVVIFGWSGKDHLVKKEIHHHLTVFEQPKKDIGPKIKVPQGPQINLESFTDVNLNPLLQLHGFRDQHETIPCDTG